VLFAREIYTFITRFSFCRPLQISLLTGTFLNFRLFKHCDLAYKCCAYYLCVIKEIDKRERENEKVSLITILENSEFSSFFLDLKKINNMNFLFILDINYIQEVDQFLITYPIVFQRKTVSLLK